jgi:guanylate kinase
LKSEILRIHNAGQFPIFDVDVVGGLNIKKVYGKRALALFIQTPSFEVLEQRLRSRATDSEESLQIRLDKVRWELNFAPQFDKIIVNDVLETALQDAERSVREFLTDERKSSIV